MDFNRYSDEDAIARCILKGGLVITNSLEADLRLFKNALRVILEHGWVQGRGGTYEDGVCAMGSLNAAGTQHMKGHGHRDFVHKFHPVTLEFTQRWIAPYTDIPSWNDAPGRTEAEVIAFFRAGIIHIEKALGIEEEPAEKPELVNA
jgi:hypothetical protein